MRPPQQDRTTHLIVAGFSVLGLLLVFALAFILGTTATEKTSRNLEEKLSLARGKVTRCDNQRDALRQKKGAGRLIRGSVAFQLQQKNEELQIENAHLVQQNDNLRDEKTVFEEAISDLRYELDVKDVLNEETTKVLSQLQDTQLLSDDLLAFLSEQARFGDIRKDELVQKLTAELRVRRDSQDQCRERIADLHQQMRETLENQRQAKDNEQAREIARSTNNENRKLSRLAQDNSKKKKYRSTIPSPTLHSKPARTLGAKKHAVGAFNRDGQEQAVDLSDMRRTGSTNFGGGATRLGNIHTNTMQHQLPQHRANQLYQQQGQARFNTQQQNPLQNNDMMLNNNQFVGVSNVAGMAGGVNGMDPMNNMQMGNTMGTVGNMGVAGHNHLRGYTQQQQQGIFNDNSHLMGHLHHQQDAMGHHHGQDMMGHHTQQQQQHHMMGHHNTMGGVTGANVHYGAAGVGAINHMDPTNGGTMGTMGAAHHNIHGGVSQQHPQYRGAGWTTAGNTQNTAAAYGRQQSNFGRHNGNTNNAFSHTGSGGISSTVAQSQNAATSMDAVTKRQKAAALAGAKQRLAALRSGAGNSGHSRRSRNK